MNWPYVWGVIGITAIGFLTFWFGWMSGHSVGRKKGFYEGWEDGCQHTQETIEAERLASPFHKRMVDANRSYLPRPDSAGPMRIHTARIRGDYRLPQTNPDRREPARPPDPTKLNIKPSESFDSD